VGKAVVSVSKPLAKHPVIIGLSTTGILSGKGLVPLALRPLYYTLLHTPHVDKIEFENAVSEGYEPNKWILVRGALYTDGPRTGVYRTGETEVGYTIRRTDVADFVVTQCIDGEGKWLGKRPVVAY
jgi:hypothetical protein